MFQTHVSIDPSCRANKFVLLWQQTKYYSIFFWSLLGSVGSLFTHHKLICVLMVLLLNTLKIYIKFRPVTQTILLALALLLICWSLVLLICWSSMLELCTKSHQQYQLKNACCSLFTHKLAFSWHSLAAHCISGNALYESYLFLSEVTCGTFLTELRLLNC